MFEIRMELFWALALREYDTYALAIGVLGRCALSQWLMRRLKAVCAFKVLAPVCQTTCMFLRPGRQ
jgi:hypothetical protein